MAATTIVAPIITYADDPQGTIQNTSSGMGPSLFLMGTGILDPRPGLTFYPGNSETEPVFGWGVDNILTVYQTPSAISAVNIAASQTPGAVALTLVAASGAGITVGTSITNRLTGATISGLLAIDGAMGTVGFGYPPQINLWNPATLISRAVRITSGGNDSGITFAVRGYDIYGYPLTEIITGANAGIAAGKKAFKYIASITPSAAVATTVSVGTSDVYGMPVRGDTFGLVDIIWNNTVIAVNTGHMAADTTTPATGTTGDVRGTYATPSASDGTKVLVIYVTIPPANLTTAVGMFGVTNYAA